MPQPSSTRRWEIDALRGLMLVLMTVTHLPTRLTDPLGQPFGFVSAAEGFVLLSAYMAGLVYGRLAWRKSIAHMTRAFWRRALVVYGCQAATLVFLFTVIAFIGVKVDQPAVKNLMALYLEQPVAALVNGLLLIYEPPLLDILPMYVLFMLASPWALALALRFGWLPLVAASVAQWVLAQFGLSEWVYQALSTWLPTPVAYEETGSFSTFAWQFLWMLGLWMGATRNDPAAPPLAFPRWAVLLACVVAAVCLVWRHAVGQAPFEANATLNLLFDKWQLGPLRLVNLFALLILTIHFGPALARRLPRVRALETLGTASLPVFCAHLAVVLLVLALFGPELDRSWWIDAPLLLGCFAVLYAVARVSLWLDQPPDDDGRPRPDDVVSAATSTRPVWRAPATGSPAARAVSSPARR
ncbi:OpgC domain-containing protein [Ramlibacter tataouinensis]|uniref:Candidate membrane protein n=1 Tax=Ramlibacter tataouinensis (strain ATCC BAA-407 / DSM 14655 / LMG 21543 / TTB310) TaxID=365046 RepID=F5Y5U1_RAMTT|nr:OpgC domain-containing protein [Ramlibacter tataouinensis]AEG93975.1 candidate membrane protein [Ramlibacter tataouinensis TTB310]